MSNVTLKFLGIFFANGCQGHSGLTKELSTPREKTQTPEGLSAKTRWHFTRGVCANGWFGAPYASYRCVATEETASAGREDHLAVAPFTNSARKDNLQLYHWVRVVNGIPPTGDYSFVKCNKSVDIVKYTDEEYEKYLTDPVWTKEETAQLFELCQRFDLRFIVIADGFPSSRTVEELKDRYYSVARARLSARAPSPGDISGHPLVKEPYNVSQETERKRALSMVLSQTKQQERKDTEVLAEAKRITESRMVASVKH